VALQIGRMPVPQPTPQAQQPQQPQQGSVAVLDGVLERVTFSDPGTGYTIARIAPDRGTGRGPVSADTELITAVGPLLGARIGEVLRLRGRWTSHLKYGRQFEVHSYATILPGAGCAAPARLCLIAGARGAGTGADSMRS
jgi:exodeoxyribonuclease V alpha subunit